MARVYIYYANFENKIYKEQDKSLVQFINYPLQRNTFQVFMGASIVSWKYARFREKPKGTTTF